MRKRLEFQADRIEAVLTMHKVPARVTGGTVTPRWVRFQVLPAVGAKISKIKGLSEELAAALDAHSCHISRRGAAVTVEVPRNDPQPVRLVPLFHRLKNEEGGIPAMTSILGVFEDGEGERPLMISLPGVKNILVVGVQGAGKTNLLRAIGLSLAWAKNHDGMPNIHIVDDLEACSGKRQREVVELAQQSGEHVIASTSDVDLVQQIGGAFPVRLVGRVASAEDACTAAGQSGSGAERLPGRGNFVAVAGGRITCFQAAFVGDEEGVRDQG